MKFGCPLISVKDSNISRTFYEQVLSQKITLDLGMNIAFGNESSVFAIQANYTELVGADSFNITYKSNDHELYFDEDNFDEFEKHLEQFNDIVYLHKTKMYPWGQRVIRFYDPDFHIIEVGESMKSVFQKFSNKGMNIDEIAKRTSHPIEFVKKYLVDN